MIDALELHWYELLEQDTTGSDKSNAGSRRFDPEVAIFVNCVQDRKIATKLGQVELLLVNHSYSVYFQRSDLYYIGIIMYSMSHLYTYAQLHCEASAVV